MKNLPHPECFPSPSVRLLSGLVGLGLLSGLELLSASVLVLASVLLSDFVLVSVLLLVVCECIIVRVSVGVSHVLLIQTLILPLYWGCLTPLYRTHMTLYHIVRVIRVHYTPRWVSLYPICVSLYTNTR